MRLYARRTSSNCQKVLWLLGELALDYELVPTGGDHGGLDAPEYLALNPNGAVPTLVDGDLAVWESHAILRYLAAAHAPERWWPVDPAARSRVDRWMDWSQSGFDASFMSLFWGYWLPLREPGRHRAAAPPRRALVRVALRARALPDPRDAPLRRPQGAAPALIPLSAARAVACPRRCERVRSR